MRYLFTSILVILSAFPAIAQKNTPMEAFIQRVKGSNEFVTVNDIWQADNNFDKKAMLEKVEDAQPLIIDYSRVKKLFDQKTMAISLVIPSGASEYVIELARYDFLTNDFEVHTLGVDNKDEKFDYTPGLYYRGVVNGIPGSVAAFSFFKNEVYGIFSIPGIGNFVVAPNVMTGKYHDYNQHYVLYNDHDLKIRQFAPKCEADQLPDYSQAAAKTTTIANNNVYNNCTEIRVFEVGDYALYLTKGSSVTNVTNFLTALFNNQSTIYRNEGIPIVLKYLQVNNATDNYQHITVSSSSRFLDTFGKVTQNALHGCDLAILASTALNGGYGALGGIAWLKAMCTSYNSSSFFGPYGFCDLDNSGVTGFPTYSWDVMVMCHEMGHIVGSPHTHRCCWNPPGTGTTAIDGCYTLEGSCPNPGNPSATVGGTIMSYCHLTSVGINFTNGFGQQPGDTIRHYIKTKFNTTCGVHYTPMYALAATNKTLNANRECTDVANGDTTTYYWQDNNTANHTDDTLVLIIKKHGNVIGDLDVAGFAVSTGTLVRHGLGRADTAVMPPGITGVLGHNMAFRRYWKINATTQPTTAVNVLFPFNLADTLDVDGSVPGVPALASYLMYKVKGTIDPNPANNFPGATSASFNIYTYGTVATTANWAFSVVGSTYLADMKTTNLTGGGGGFVTYNRTGITNLHEMDAAVYVYPNPSNDVFNFEAAGAFIKGISVTDIQGRIVKSIVLPGTSASVSIHVSELPAGLYYAQVQTDAGTAVKKIVVMK